MSNARYFAFAKPGAQGVINGKSDNRTEVIEMDSRFIKGCIYGNANWITGPYKKEGMVKHRSDELIMFIGGDPKDPENLNAEIELWIENDKLVFSKTSILFVPGGAAHGRIEVRNLNRPVFQYTCHINSDSYEEIPAKAAAAPGTYSKNRIEKYAPVGGRLPTAPEGFLTLLLWIDGKRIMGAPYLEAVWFNTVNNEGPAAHTHDFDEYIGLFGTDPEHPDDLGAELTFSIGDEVITVAKSCLVYIPRGLMHSPILVPKMKRPIIHFSGGNGGDYVRVGTDQF